MNLFKTPKKILIVSLSIVLLLSAFVAPTISFANESTSSVVKFSSNLKSEQLTTSFKKLGVDAEHLFNGSPEMSKQNFFVLNTGKDLKVVQKNLEKNIELVQPNSEFSLNLIEASLTPDDPGFTTNGANIDKQWGLVKTKFNEAWDLTVGSNEVIVAIIDTGIDGTHEDLDGARIVPGYDVINERAISPRADSDQNGHGTLVAGIIGADANNGTGIVGGAWDVGLMPIRALSDSGTGVASDIAKAIIWATDNDADIINLSLGGTGFSHNTVLSEAISYAFDRNVIIVAAAGNDAAVTGGNLDNEPVFPICNDNGKNMIIGVTATDVNDLKPSFANYGKNCIDVTAPGRRILSTINHDPSTGRYESDAYAYASGTSLAVPYVSAQAVLLKSLNPTATNRQIRDSIISTATNIDNLNLSQCGGQSCRGLIGVGRIDVISSLLEPFPTIIDGDIVKVRDNNDWYLINGSKRQFISPFVKQQRFSGVIPKEVSSEDLQRYPESSYAAPLEGTLVKVFDSEAVYYISQGLKLPVTYQVFLLREFTFANVYTLSSTEVNSWLTGSLLTPPEGALLRTGNNPTVYWVTGGVLHPINDRFFIERGLSVFPVVYVADTDIDSFPKSTPYIL